MFNNTSPVDYDAIYITCGYTNLHRSIDELATIVQNEFELDSFQNVLILFCGRRTIVLGRR
ncbi:IS66 family insertion sequence element accessory protein TnpB [Vallitalea longa]|uniref:IS66 family insertion sequence element accessory protein TnpB n=1 Tax=Vallitalea longa TaxID=2936439 RepID=UPI003365B21C